MLNVLLAMSITRKILRRVFENKTWEGIRKQNLGGYSKTKLGRVFENKTWEGIRKHLDYLTFRLLK